MVRLRIDNIDCESPEGTTVLEAAESAGINIPTLCNKEGLPHYSSCMVCMVKDNKSKCFIPSCSALVQPGMDIDASGDDVVLIRKKAVELLLSEHRAECEAQCRIVCPAGYNIPLMNRLLAAGDIETALKVSLDGLNSNEIQCVNCPGYCENACRRKRIDTPVSIRNLQLFIFQRINQKEKLQYFADNQGAKVVKSEKIKIKSRSKNKRFNSHIGKLEASELKEWLKECTGEDTRHREITDSESAFKEAKSCMHCDCRAAEDCRLRDIAESFSMKDPSGKLTYSSAEKKINIQTNLIFENAKCIKCGLCVRICEDKNDDPLLCFINRGFVSIISEPLTCDFVETMKSTAKKCIEICPTGALAYFK
jgi:predicted molibdopterin-dependent oxidoreductase YjgC